MTIYFKDGSTLLVDVNETTFITDVKPNFPSDLSVVTIGDRICKNAFIQECASIDNKYCFTILEKTKEEIWRESIEDALCELSMEI